MTQQDNADFCEERVRSDVLQFEPVDLLPVFLSADEVILSVKLNGTEDYVDVTYVIHNFDKLLVEFFLVVLFLQVSILMLSFHLNEAFHSRVSLL